MWSLKNKHVPSLLLCAILLQCGYMMGCFFYHWCWFCFLWIWRHPNISYKSRTYIVTRGKLGPWSFLCVFISVCLVLRFFFSCSQAPSFFSHIWALRSDKTIEWVSRACSAALYQSSVSQLKGMCCSTTPKKSKGSSCWWNVVCNNYLGSCSTTQKNKNRFVFLLFGLFSDLKCKYYYKTDEGVWIPDDTPCIVWWNDVILVGGYSW